MREEKRGGERASTRVPSNHICRMQSPSGTVASNPLPPHMQNAVTVSQSRLKCLAATYAVCSHLKLTTLHRISGDLAVDAVASNHTGHQLPHTHGCILIMWWGVDYRRLYMRLQQDAHVGRVMPRCQRPSHLHGIVGQDRPVRNAPPLCMTLTLLMPPLLYHTVRSEIPPCYMTVRTLVHDRPDLLKCNHADSSLTASRSSLDDFKCS